MPVNLPTAKDVRSARAQARRTVNENLEQVRPPFLAAIGTTDLAVAAVRDALTCARTRAQAVQDQLPRDLGELRGRLSAEDVRRYAEGYGNAARGVYQILVRRGADVLDKIKAQPPVKRVLDTLDTVSDQVEGRVEDAAEGFRERGNDVLGRVTHVTRSVGEQAGRTSQRVGSQAAAAAEEIGDEAAHAARSSSRKVAHRTAPAKPAPRRASGPVTK